MAMEEYQKLEGVRMENSDKVLYHSVSKGSCDEEGSECKNFIKTHLKLLEDTVKNIAFDRVHRIGPMRAATGRPLKQLLSEHLSVSGTSDTNWNFKSGSEAAHAKTVSGCRDLAVPGIVTSPEAELLTSADSGALKPKRHPELADSHPQLQLPQPGVSTPAGPASALTGGSGEPRQPSISAGAPRRRGSEGQTVTAAHFPPTRPLEDPAHVDLEGRVLRRMQPVSAQQGRGAECIQTPADCLCSFGQRYSVHCDPESRTQPEMADPGSQPPAETSSPPPARSSDAGLRDFDPSLDPEIQEGEGEQDLLPDLERPEGKKDGADRALNKSKPPELHLHKGVTGEGHRRIGGQKLRAISHMTSAAAASPTTGPSTRHKVTQSHKEQKHQKGGRAAATLHEL
uniref:uncharacterized protein LOC112432140 n=1 Tax=Maylandia zebra TaxID=106582 RepID=UPI000D30EBB0|nr:uncharacterized protein LOC112432140 [Maylandia zebra]